MEINQNMEEINSAFYKYLDIYFKERDLEKTLSMLSPNITGYGTGFDEKSYNHKDFTKLYERDITQAPNSISYDILKITTNSPTKNIGIISCELNISTEIMNQEIKLNNLRLSSVFIKNNLEWLMEHMHISFPTNAHGENEPYPIKELEERNILLEKLVKEKTKKLEIALEKNHKLAITDHLTGLNNRVEIEKSLQKELNRATRYNSYFSLMIIDIDYFKKVNDTYGHLTGDNILVSFANILLTDTRNTDIVGRWGGEEFLIICPETNSFQAKLLSEKLRKAISEFCFDTIKSLTSSFGVTSFENGDTIDKIISRADKALYQAKDQGRNTVVVC